MVLDVSRCNGFVLPDTLADPAGPAEGCRRAEDGKRCGNWNSFRREADSVTPTSDGAEGDVAKEAWSAEGDRRLSVGGAGGDGWNVRTRTIVVVEAPGDARKEIRLAEGIGAGDQRDPADGAGAGKTEIVERKIKGATGRSPSGQIPDPERLIVGVAVGGNPAGGIIEQSRWILANDQRS